MARKVVAWYTGTEMDLNEAREDLELILESDIDLIVLHKNAAYENCKDIKEIVDSIRVDKKGIDIVAFDADISQDIIAGLFKDENGKMEIIRQTIDKKGRHIGWEKIVKVETL